jgi:hypothetical protein
MISASLADILSVARGWVESKARIRFIAEVKNGMVEFECSVHSASDSGVLLLVSGQTRGLASIELSDCKLSFGDDDIPSAERTIGLRLGVAISVITPASDSFWLIEMRD